ncbi:hypothetical protein Tco_0852081 [Tanacetum coccineum]
MKIQAGGNQSSRPEQLQDNFSFGSALEDFISVVFVPDRNIITADVLEIYMQESRATATVHHHLIRFKMNNKKHIVDFDACSTLNEHEDTQLYGAIFPDELTNEAIKDSESYKEYYAIASGAEPPKTKASVKKKQAGSDKTKTPPTAKGKRLKTSAKAAKPAKKKQPAKTSKAKGLTVLSEVALTEAEQMKLATKRSLIQMHSSHASGSSADEGTCGKLGVPDVPTYESDDEQISWKSSDEEDDDDDNDDDEDNDDDDDNDDVDDDADNQDDDGQDDNVQEYDGQDDEGQYDDNEQTDSDNDGDGFVHPKFSTHDQEERQDDEDKEDEWSDDEVYDDENQGANVEGEELDEEKTNEEDEANELYKDVNVNLEGRDAEMTDAPCTIVQTTQVIEDTHVIVTLVNPEGIDSIFNLKTESTSLVDVPVSTTVEIPPSSETTIPSPPVSLIQPLQQTPVSTPTIVPIVSSIPGIVDTYLENKMNKAVKTVVQLQSDRLRDKAQAKNSDFINKLDDNIKKIIKEQVKAQVKEQTSHAVAANLSKLELKKIFIDKIETNKSIHRSDHQKTLYKALVDAYESDKLILDTYGDTVTIKRIQDDQDEDDEPSAGSNRGSKRRRAGKEPESTSAPKEKTSKSLGKSKEGSKSQHTSTGKSAHVEEPIHVDKDLEELARQEFDTRFSEDQPVDETTQHHDWFHKPTKPPTPDRDWNKTSPAAHGPIQPWISNLAQKEDTRDLFNELTDTPLDFSAFMMNRLKVDTLTPELLAGLTFKLMKGSCKSLVEFEYFLEEVYKETTDQLDWNNPKGQQYPHDLRKPLTLIPSSHGRRVIHFG